MIRSVEQIGSYGGSENEDNTDREPGKQAGGSTVGTGAKVSAGAGTGNCAAQKPACSHRSGSRPASS